LLKPYLPDGKVQPPPPPEMIDGEFEYEVEAILSHRFKRGNKIEYLVRWKGYGHEYDTWEPEENCANSSELVSEYWGARIKVQTEKKPVSKRKSKKRGRQDDAAVTDTGRALRSSKRRR